MTIETIWLRAAENTDLPPASPKPTATSDGVLESAKTIWESADGRISVGVWECTSGTFTARREGYAETCQLLSGRVTIRTAADAVTVTAGDTVVMPDGWEGTWEVHETVRKTYITVVS